MNPIEIKIDYFSVTFPLDLSANESTQFKVHETVEELSTYLNVQNFEIEKTKYAQNNFNYQYQLGEHITLRLDGPMNDCYQKTCQLEMKGEGCRDFEKRNPEKTWITLILYMIEHNAKFKRMDIAVDDYEGEYITLPYLLNKILNKHYTSIFKSPANPLGTLETGLTIQFGSNQSSTELVIYDKKQERKKRKKFCDKDYWVRYEMRFRNETAEKIICQLIKTKDLQTFSFQHLYRILDIKESNHYDVTQQHKIPTDSKWLDFLHHVQKGELAKQPKLEDKTFTDYLKAASPYISIWLLVRYLQVLKDPYLFEIEIYKYMKNELIFSKKRFQRLNIFLSQYNLKPIDDIELATINLEFSKILEEKELPF